MQVTESYLMSRLAPGLGAWLATMYDDADEELSGAFRLLQYHTQVRACLQQRLPLLTLLPVATAATSVAVGW